MALNDRKITVYGNPVANLPDHPSQEGFTAERLKAAFDAIANEEVKSTINGIIDDLIASLDGASGADQIGATAIQNLDGATVQAILESLRNKLKSTTDNSSGADFIGATAISNLDGATVQAILESLRNKLKSTADGSSGADFIGATALKAGGATTVQGQLEELTANIETVNSNESTRVTQETARVTAENLRSTAEILRANAATSQANTESLRVIAEDERVIAEQEREEADILRGQTVGAIETNYAPRLTSVEGQINTLDAEVNAIPNQTYITEKATKSEVEIERQRINNFTSLAEGSTTGDAELIDLRIGADGITYANAGGAIRGQIGNLKEDLVNQENALINGETLVKSLKWSSGELSGLSVGSKVTVYTGGTSATTRKNVFVDVMYDSILTVASGYKVKTYIIDSNNNFVGGSIDVSGKSSTLSKNRYAFVLSENSNADISNIDVSEIVSLTTSTAFDCLKNEISNTKAEISNSVAFDKFNTLSLTVKSDFITDTTTLAQSALLNFQTTTINVSAGENYLITGWSNDTNYAPAFWSDNALVDKITIGYYNFMDIAVVVPDGATKLIVNGRVGSGYNTIVIKKRLANAESINFWEEYNGLKFDNSQLERRILNAEKGNDFAWSAFDKPYFVFIHDDANDYLETYSNVFISNSVPMGSAVITSVLNDAKIAILNTIVSNGGEVLAHYDASPTESSTDAEWLACTRDVKKSLEELGFEVRGIIRANNTEKSTKKGEKYCRKYFDYANDKMGISTQYDLPRTLMLDFTDLNAFKAQLDADAQINGIHAYGFHGGRSDEQWITAENMTEIINYIKAKGNCEITTYSNIFDVFESTVLLERIKVLENA